MSQTTPLTRLVREAVSSLAEPEWRVRGVGALRRHDNGYWAQIVFGGATRKEEPLEVGLTAGVVSPYLLRVVNRQDPDKPPRSSFVAAHASVVWDQRVTFISKSARKTPQFSLPDPHEPRPVIVGVDHVAAWVTDALATLAPLCDELCSDDALLDRLLSDGGHGRRTAFGLRCAALLARRLGDSHRLERALADAAAVYQENVDRAVAAWGHLPGASDDQDTYPQDWSHVRFLRFLDETPR